MKAHNRLIKRFALIMTAILCLNTFAASAGAAETTVIVNLDKKIKSDFQTMGKVTRESNEKGKNLNNEIESVVNKIDGAEEGPERDALRNQYLRMRTEQLYVNAKKLTQLGTLSSNIARNMVNLQDEMRNYGKGINGGFRLTPVDVKAVGMTIKGSVRLIAPIVAMKGGDDPRVRNLIMTLRNLDSRLRFVFNGAAENSSSLEEKIRYMEDLNAWTESAKALLNEERLYLQTTIFTRMSDRIVQGINDISKDIYQNKGGMVADYSAMHEMDTRVLGRRAAIRPFGGPVDINLEEMGNYGGQK